MYIDKFQKYILFLLYFLWRYNKVNEEYKKKIEKLKQELLIMKTLNIKPNYSELSRIYKLDRRTIEKYNNGYCRENIKIIRKSKLDDLKDEIKEKLELPGITVTGLYQYFSKDKMILEHIPIFINT